MVGDIMQPTHLLFVLVVALLVLGPKRLPEVGRTLGSGIRDFRQALSGDSEHHQDREPEQVPSTAHGPEHQPDFTEDHEVIWPEEAVGPATYDEPVEAASGESSHPVQAISGDATATAHTPPAHPEPGHAGALDDVPLDEAGAVRASAEATRIVEPGASTVDGSPEPRTGSSL